MGTELERRGIPSSLPLWSARALEICPDTVREIHLEYARAGAEVLTANSFRTQGHTFAKLGRRAEAAEKTHLAVALAREAAWQQRSEAAGEGPPPAIWIAGSAPTLEDCYRPDLVPDEATLQREHEAHAALLVEAGVDFILIETMNTLREALAALRAARSAGAASWLSFCIGEEGRLLSGEPLAQALERAAREEPMALLVNCLPARAVAPCLPLLRCSGLPFGAYPNFGEPVEEAEGEGAPRWRNELPPDAFAASAGEWAEEGARILGGCCGTRPAHIRALARSLASDQDPS